MTIAILIHEVNVPPPCRVYLRDTLVLIVEVGVAQDLRPLPRASVDGQHSLPVFESAERAVRAWRRRARRSYRRIAARTAVSRNGGSSR